MSEPVEGTLTAGEVTSVEIAAVVYEVIVSATDADIWVSTDGETPFVGNPNTAQRVPAGAGPRTLEVVAPTNPTVVKLVSRGAAGFTVVAGPQSPFEDHDQHDHTGIPGVGDEQSGASVADLSAYVGDVSLQADEGLALGSGEAPYNNGPGSLAIQVTDGEGTYATVDMLPNGTILLSGESVRLSGTATRVAGDAVGFYTTPAIAKPSGVAVTVEAIHAALVALGLIAGP